jgi:hypothetical protein
MTDQIGFTETGCESLVVVTVTLKSSGMATAVDFEGVGGLNARVALGLGFANGVSDVTIAV